MNMHRLLPTLALLAAPLSAQVLDLGGACAGLFPAPALAATIPGPSLSLAMTSPGSPHSSISLGVIVVGFGIAGVTLPCGCTIAPTVDSLLVAGFFTSSMVPTITVPVPTGLTGSLVLFQGLEFFDPAAPIAAGAGCTDFGLAFNATNALAVWLP